MELSGILLLTVSNCGVFAAGSMCSTGSFDSSRHFSPYCKPCIVGFLCIFGSCICHASASRNAEYQGMSSRVLVSLKDVQCFGFCNDHLVLLSFGYKFFRVLALRQSCVYQYVNTLYSGHFLLPQLDFLVVLGDDSSKCNFTGETFVYHFYFHLCTI